MIEHIKRAFEIASMMKVAGENVDLMAAVRHELRMAYQEAEREETKDAQGVTAQEGEENG